MMDVNIWDLSFNTFFVYEEYWQHCKMKSAGVLSGNITMVKDRLCESVVCGKRRLCVTLLDVKESRAKDCERQCVKELCVKGAKELCACVCVCV